MIITLLDLMLKKL